MKKSNSDYNNQMSNISEASMAKRTLLTMAKDLYNLYLSLNDNEGLPEWCDYKIARSQNELEAVTNFITSKIAKTCVDQNISTDKLCEHASETILRDLVREGLVDSIKGIFRKKPEVRYAQTIDDLMLQIDRESGKNEKYYHLSLIQDMVSIFKKVNKQKPILKRITARKMTDLRWGDEELDDYTRRKASIDLSGLNRRGEEQHIHNFYEEPIGKYIKALSESARIIQIYLDAIKKRIAGPKITSARKVTSARKGFNESLDREMKSSFDEIKLLGRDASRIWFEKIAIFETKNLLYYIYKQINELCENDSEKAVQLITYYQRIIGETISLADEVEKLHIEKLEDIYDQYWKTTFFLFITITISCSRSINYENIRLIDPETSITSGETYEIKYETDVEYEYVNAFLKDNSGNIKEIYTEQKYSNVYFINRIAQIDLRYNESYFLELVFYNENTTSNATINLQIEPSVIVESFCATNDCEIISGNVVQNVYNKLSVKTYKIAAKKIKYIIDTPYNKDTFEHEFTSPVNEDYIERLSFKDVPGNISSYIASINIIAYDDEGNTAETALPFRVVRPLEVKHFGKYELAETYEPVPVTGCIPGTVGNSVQYSESETEVRQSSVSITLSSSNSNSLSQNQTNTQSEGISVSNTESTILSSSLSSSETNSEGYSNTYSEGESSNIGFSTSDGENWSWNLNESSSNTSSNSNTGNVNTGVSGSVTTGFSGEGSLPFLAKASGKVETSAGISRNWGESQTSGQSTSSGESRGYATGGSSQNGRMYGSSQNNTRGHSLSGTYVLSRNISNALTESTSLSSGRVWNMSESLSSGKVVTEGNSESLSETIVSSNSSTTTFSYSGYIPRGRYGKFYRQTSRYVKLSEIITYDLNGVPSHGGFITMNSWAWAPELSIGEDCNEMTEPNLPKPECFIAPCGDWSCHTK